jgi:hypothetical protein
MSDLSRVTWRKSSHSCSNNCVEVAFLGDMIAVRDSKEPSGPALLFNLDEWRSFLAGVVDREFEPPAG